MTSINIPKLRFPEYSGEWEKKRLGEVTTWKSGGTPPKENNEYWGGNVPWISGSSMKGNEYFDSEVKLTELGVKNGSKIAAKGSLLLLVRGSMLFNKIPVGIAMRDLAFNQDVKSITPVNTLESKYVLYWFISKENVLMDLVSGTGIGAGKLDISDLQGQEFVYPSLPEQQKISSFLTAVNDKLQGLKKKKSLLEQYKKGVMQKIFSQELRFKSNDGSEFPEWEIKKLGEVCEIIMGQSPSSNSYNVDEFGIPLIQGNADIQNRLSSPRNWTTEKTKECKIGDLILTVRAPVGAVAKSIHNACIGRGVCAVRNNSTSMNEFLYQFLLDYETKWSSLEQGSTFTAVSGVEIKKLIIRLPSLPEQTKIANFLSAIDERIQLVQGQVEKMEMWKKGLLQKMFV